MQFIKGNNLLSRAQCNVLRGLAITGIFLHNFCHWLHGAHHENEYIYYLEHGQTSWNYWTQGIDWFFPIQFFSFFGHFGVPLFLFLSGWGLAMKYEKDDSSSIKPLPFIKYHWLKLFRLMVLGYLLSIVTYAAFGFGFHPWYEILSQLTMVVNAIFVSPGSALSPGPYWFFGLMLEVYVFYILFLYPTRNKGCWRWLMPVLSIAVAIAVQVPLETHTTILNYMRYNLVVAMLPMSLGILMARYGLPRLRRGTLAVVAVVSLVMLAAFNLNYQLWLWAPVLVVTGAVAAVKCFASGSVILKPMQWMGVMSSFIFVVHSIPRMPIFKLWLWKQPEMLLTDYAWLALYIALTLLLAWLYKQYLRLIPSPTLKR
jgi:peptidoglycan/LPS O-acetylase OafA/YrhL